MSILAETNPFEVGASLNWDRALLKYFIMANTGFDLTATINQFEVDVLLLIDRQGGVIENRE